MYKTERVIDRCANSPAIMGPCSRPRRVLLAATIFIFCLYFSLDRWSQFTWASEASASVCPQSPLGDDILVVLRTGATEAHEKLPIHFQTVVTCLPDFVIYSDSGWKLDKWKFMPMVDRALRHRPEAKWFVFVEGDTYLVWQNMLEWLSKFDPEQPHYLGKHMYIGDVLFGHGGSGFVLSNPAMQKVSRRWRETKTDIEAYTAEQWAGDMVLGKVIKDVGVDMFWAFPNLQGDSPTTIDWNVSKLGREPWCYAPTTFHHMNSLEYEALWRFEQRWLVGHPGTTPIFGDVFKGVILPQFREKRESWDNMAAGVEHSAEAFAELPEEDRDALTYAEQQAPGSFEGCRTLCECKRDCIQFSFSQGRCTTSTELRLGHAADSPCLEYSNAASRCLKPAGPRNGTLSSSNQSIQAGWMMDRVTNYIEHLDGSCALSEEWVS